MKNNMFTSETVIKEYTELCKKERLMLEIPSESIPHLDFSDSLAVKSVCTYFNQPTPINFIDRVALNVKYEAWVRFKLASEIIEYAGII